MIVTLTIFSPLIEFKIVCSFGHISCRNFHQNEYSAESSSIVKSGDSTGINFNP